MKEINDQQKLIESYGMIDERYINSFNELISTLCMRLFKNMVPMFFEILEKMKADQFFEGKICLTNGPVDLFKLVNQIFESYNQCPCQEVCNGLLSLIFK